MAAAKAIQDDFIRREEERLAIESERAKVTAMLREMSLPGQF